MASVEAHGGALVTGVAGAPNRFTVFTQGHNVAGLSVAFEGPSKPEISFANQKDGSVEVCYTPKCGGDYKIYVKYDSKDVRGSPFKCNIAGDIQQTRGLVQKVKCSGPALKEGHTHLTNEFLVDTKEAGISGGLQVAMEGPSKPEVSFKDNKDGTLKVCYKPDKAGQYKIHLKFGDLHVPGSPFVINVK